MEMFATSNVNQNSWKFNYANNVFSCTVNVLCYSESVSIVCVQLVAILIVWLYTAVKTVIKFRSSYNAHQNKSNEFLLCFQSSNRFYLCYFSFYGDSKRCQVSFAGDCIGMSSLYRDFPFFKPNSFTVHENIHVDLDSIWIWK